MTTTSVAIERTPDGSRLVVSRRIATAPAAVWDLLVRPDRWPSWGPSISAVRCDAARIERGTTGTVRTRGGLWLPFEVTACEDRRWTWRIGPVPATGHRVEPAGADRCVAAFEIPLLAAPYALVCWLALRRLDRLVGEH